MEILDCSIYKSSRKADAYLFIPQNDELKNLPGPLLQALGKLELVMDLSLTAGKKLAQSDARSVIKALKSQGYYLQLPARKLPISQ